MSRESSPSCAACSTEKPGLVYQYPSKSWQRLYISPQNPLVKRCNFRCSRYHSLLFLRVVQTWGSES
jgi:hypothetical protein